MQEYNISQKRRKATLIINYTLMSIAVIVISAICVFFALGYRFDFGTNKVEQRALLQFGTTPTAATVTVDDTQLSSVTPGKKEVSAGTHRVTYTKDGYRSWQRDVTVKSGELVWLNYARLVPSTIQTNVLKELTGYAESKPSPDQTMFAVITKADAATLDILKVSNPKAVTLESLTIPSTVLALPAGATQAYHVVGWSESSKYVLIQHTNGTTSEYLRVNVSDGSDTINLSTKFGLTLSDAYFSSDTVFYGLENGNIRRLDLSSGQVSEPIVRDVISMRLYGENDLSYVQHKPDQFVVGIAADGKGAHTVRTYSDTAAVLVVTSKYYNDRYMAITRGNTLEVIKNPEKITSEGMQQVVSLTYPAELRWLSFSSKGRSVIAGSGGQFVSYDIERDVRVDANFPTIVADQSIMPQWLDTMTLVSTGDNKLRLSDFDGANQQIICDTLPSQPVMLSRDGTLLFSFTKTQSGATSLQASTLTTK